MDTFIGLQIYYKNLKEMSIEYRLLTNILVTVRFFLTKEEVQKYEREIVKVDRTTKKVG